MEDQPKQPDPVDGLHLAMLQQRRDELLLKASGRVSGFMLWLLVFMLVCGAAVIILTLFTDSKRPLGFSMGALLIAQALFVWWSWRRAARRQLQSLNRQIQFILTQPDAAVIARAAAAARATLLRR